jgi:hypothetical protein
MKTNQAITDRGGSNGEEPSRILLCQTLICASTHRVYLDIAIMTASWSGEAQVVGQTSGLPVAKPPVSPAVTDRHPEDALTSRPEVCTTLAIVTRCTPTHRVLGIAIVSRAPLCPYSDS